MLTAGQKQQLLTQATKDEVFRAALQRDARAAVAQALHVTLPPETTLHVLQGDPRQIVLVLPPYPAEWPAGLSADALEQRLMAGTGPLEPAQETVVRGQAHLIARAWHDATFKQALLGNPRGIVEREFGVGLPAEVVMRVVAEDAHAQYLVLPPALDDLELSDEQLQQVAGGEYLIAGTILATLAVASALAGASASASIVVGTSDW